MDSKTDPDNRVTTFTWTSARQLESESNPAMAGTSRFKNIYVNNAVTQQLDGKNKAWLYRRTLDANNNVIAAETEDPLHRITKYGFSVGFAAPDWIDDPDGRRTKFTYDTKLRIASVEMPSGKKATYVRDGRGNITSVTTTPSAAVASDQAQLLYSASFPTSCDSSNWRICNLPTSVTNPNQQTTDFTYDLNHGGLLTSLGPGSTPASRSFTKIAYATFVRAPTVETSSTTAPLRDVSLPVSAENCLSSNGTAGYVCPVSDSIKKTVTYTPSTATSRSQFLPYAVTDDPAGFNLTSSRTFDIVGNIVKTDGPRNDADIATMSFDKARHLTRQVSPDPDDSGPLAAPEINIDYDQSGRVLALRRRLNSADVTSSATYDADGGVSSFTSPESGTVNFVYDDAGEMIEVNQLVDGVTRRTKQSFDAVGRVSDVKAVSDSGTDVLKATYSYDPDGNVVTIGDGNGNKTNYCYDGFGRLKEVRFPSTSTPGSSTACSVTPAGGLPSTADFESYVLDAAGNPTSIRLRDGRTIAQSYDGAGRLQTTDVPEAGKDVTRAYDLLGRLTSATMAGDSSLSVGLAYDKLGRIVSSTSLGKTVSRSYAADGTSVQLVYPDSKALLYNVDRLGRVSEIWGIDEPTYGGTRSPQLAAFTYDQLSRRTRVDRGNTSSTIATYDSSQRLQDLFFDFSGTANDLHRTFTYNQAGEIKTTAVDNDGFAALVDAGTHNYAANGLNQYQSVDGVSVPYDGLGNLTGLAGKTFAYDSADALTNVSDGSGSTDLAYDALGRLAKISRGGSTTQFVYGTGGLLAEYDGAGTLLKRYVPGPDSDEPLVAYDGGTNKTWLYGDERGSIVAAADGSGNVISKVLYGPYGEGGQAALGRFGFTGQVYLPEIGLYDFKSRFYNPAIGRFMQTDAAGYAGGLNLYAYADGDPANLTDPMGTDPAPILWPLPPVTATIPPSNSSGSGGSMPPPSSIFTGWSDYGGWGALASMADNALRWQAWQRAHRGPAEEYAAQCTDGVSGSWMESARTVLGWTQVGADAVTLGAAATGIGGPVAITAKIVGLGAEGALGAINLYDCYANSACGHLADQAVGLSTRLIPGGSLRQMNKLLNGPARDVKGRFARSLWTSKKEAIDEAQKQGQRFFAEKASESIRCEK
jgi:RHS repeat-associated protein